MLVFGSIAELPDLSEVGLVVVSGSSAAADWYHNGQIPGSGCALQFVRVSRCLFAVNGVAVLCAVACCRTSAGVGVAGIGLTGVLWLVGTTSFVADRAFAARKLWV